jgi:hypothetical protein
LLNDNHSREAFSLPGRYCARAIGLNVNDIRMVARISESAGFRRPE